MSSSSTSQMKKDAIAAMSFAYSPYSQRKIGASLRLANGKTYSGCNIENASYGGTVCAERVAVWKAFSENPSTEKIKEVIVASAENDPWPPCGFCRQVIAEFAEPSTIITLINPAGKETSYTLEQLLPAAFKSEHLQKIKNPQSSD